MLAAKPVIVALEAVPGAAGVQDLSSVTVPEVKDVAVFPAAAQESAQAKAGGSAYAIAAPLKTTGTYWCIDSTGAAKGTVGTGTTAYDGLNGVGDKALADGDDVTCQ